jgi:hypothetical protein
MQFTETVLTESKSARNSQLESISHDRASAILDKVKGLYFALWQGVGIAATEVIATFYEVPETNIRQLLKNHRDEFESDGLKTLRNKGLNEVRDLLSLTSLTVNATAWTPRAALRLGMVLRDSAVAKAVRTSLLDAVEHVIPTQAQEIERLRMELQIIQMKQKYLDLCNAIATSTSDARLAFLRGDAPMPPRTEYRDRFVDPATGREVGKSTGVSLKQLVRDAGLNPESTRDRNKVKLMLKGLGFDYDKQQGWSTASYLREYRVLESEIYPTVLKRLVSELNSTGEQNLFVYQLNQENKNLLS